MPISVLPRPKKVAEHKGAFPFDQPTPIVLSGRSEPAERVAAFLLADAVEDAGGPPCPVERHGKLDGLAGPAVLMLLLGRDERLCPALRKLKPARDLGPEGYVIEVKAGRVTVAANAAAGLFYAAQTLVQLLGQGDGAQKRARQRLAAKRTNLPCCRIVDWPDFKYRGFMLDVSRFRVPRHETLVRLVFRLAACKINCLQLYVEHTFACRRRPGYWAGCSPLTAEQLAELDELCAMLHIELQANQNSLGHLQHLLSQPGFERYAERPASMGAIFNERGRPMPLPWSLRLDDPGVYALLDDIYAEHLTAVRSPLVNLGCDEVYDLGTGRSKALVERKGKVRAFTDHVRRIAALARRYGKTTMIWDDMIRHHPEALRRLPKDVVPIFWHYNDVPGDSYWRIWGRSGRRHWVAPGCCGWQSIFAQIDRAWDNIHWVADFGRRGRAEGLLNTEWGDRGNFQTLAAAYHGIALGGELSWNSKPMAKADKGDFDRRFARAVFNDPTGRMGRLYRLLGSTNHVFTDRPYQARSFAIYWDVFPAGPELVKVKLSEMDKAARLAEQGLTLARELRDDPPPGVEDSLFEEIILAAKQTIFAATKARLAKRVRAALGPAAAAKTGAGRTARKKLPAGLKRDLRRFLAEWDRQKAEFRRVWLLTNEPSQIGFRLTRFAQARQELVRLLK